MSHIQQKIITLSVIVVFIMAVIWTILTYYNQKSLEQYNEILQRYLRMNEVSMNSQESVTNLNNYLLAPSDERMILLTDSVQHVKEIRLQLNELQDQENSFTLTNYKNMIGSLIESIDLTVMMHKQSNRPARNSYFIEATKISKYISETTLTLVSQELRTYDQFYRNIIEQSANLKRLGFSMMSLISILMVLFSYYFAKGITRPIKQLTFAARELSRGRFDLEIEVNSNDEIAFLARTFDRMRININNLILEIQQKAQLESDLQESKLLLRESQLKSLQSQINPHFLYNTLNTLSKKAYLEGSKETSDLIANVAGLLRYNLKRIDREVTLGEEVNIILQYMDIQKARFTDRLHFQLDADENCYSIKLPGMTLQPIIENAVHYAIEPREEGGTIRMTIKDTDSRVEVLIVDDGEGMEVDKVQHILSELQESSDMEGHSTGIGLSNVIRRLRLLYGREDVIEIISEPGVGTSITLLLPKKMME
jgi:sensor histidine kinase YesM